MAEQAVQQEKGAPHAMSLATREQEMRALNEQLERRRQLVLQRVQEMTNAVDSRAPPRPATAAASVSLARHPADLSGVEADTKTLPGGRENTGDDPADQQDASGADENGGNVSVGAEEAASAYPDAVAIDIASVSVQRPHSAPGIHPLAACSDAEESFDLGELQALPPEASSRLLQAKVRVLEQDLEGTKQLLRHQSATADEHAARLRDAIEAKNKLERAKTTLQSTLERERRATATAKQRAEKAEALVASLRKDLEEAQRAGVTEDRAARSKDARLNRALEDVERHRRIAAETESSTNEKVQAALAQAEAATAEKKRVVRHNGELRAVMKKQAKLIDVLKRQKLHLAASRYLQLSEEEFTSVLEQGEKL